MDEQAVDGRHTSIELLLAGVPQATAQATDINSKARYDTIETKLLGSNSPLIDKDHTGWEGSITFAQRSKALDLFINAYNKAKRAGLPVVLNIVDRLKFRDGSSIMHIYSKVQVDFDKTSKRGSATEIKLGWITGEDRKSI